jgi:5-methylcytosine-specific restriction endonuclease McrA
VSKHVRVLIGDNGLPVRIFRDKQWLEFAPSLVPLMDRAHAVAIIRELVYERSHVDLPEAGYDVHECERCGRQITWETFEMHETVPKGKGGEVSVENCEALCHNCHTGSPDSAHGNRRWQTAKLSPEG